MEHKSIELVRAFHDALHAHDVDGMMRRMTDDCVFENTYPAPDGTRYIGQAAVRTFWQEFFATTRAAHFEIEDIFAAADGARVAMAWTYHWTAVGGNAGHVRGADLYRIENNLIAEKWSYVKG